MKRLSAEANWLVGTDAIQNMLREIRSVQNDPPQTPSTGRLLVEKYIFFPLNYILFLQYGSGRDPCIRREETQKPANRSTTKLLKSRTSRRSDILRVRSVCRLCTWAKGINDASSSEYRRRGSKGCNHFDKMIPSCRTNVPIY